MSESLNGALLLLIVTYHGKYVTYSLIVITMASNMDTVNIIIYTYVVIILYIRHQILFHLIHSTVKKLSHILALFRWSK